MNDRIAYSSTERQNRIFRWITRQQRITVVEICQEFGISQATARRDLDFLANHSKIQRVHGGAITLEAAPPEQPILKRQDEQTQAKQRIGQAGADLVKEGETVFLGSGSTVLEVARNLKNTRKLTVLTNSLPVVNLLADHPEFTLVCLGGMLRSSELSFIGHLAEQALGELRADKIFIGVRAISLEQGLTNEYLPETMTDRAILRIGREVVVVADYTKFGRIAPALLAPIESIHILVTDAQTSKHYIENLSLRGLKVIVA